MDRAALAVKDEFREAFGQFMEAVPFWYYVWDMDRAEWFDVRSDPEDYFEDYRVWMGEALRDVSLVEGNRFLDARLLQRR